MILRGDHGYSLLNEARAVKHDHIFDHKQIRNIWKQWTKEHTRASLPERKAAEMAVKCQKNGFLTVRDQGKTMKKRSKAGKL